MSNFIQSWFSIAKGIFECQNGCILAFNNLKSVFDYCQRFGHAKHNLLQLKTFYL